MALVGDAAGYVTKCSGEGIYFAAKSGRMAAEAIVEGSAQGKKMVGQGGWGLACVLTGQKEIGRASCRERVCQYV